MTGTVDTTQIGDYIITYTATDLAGNISTATRTVKVVSNKYISKYFLGKIMVTEKIGKFGVLMAQMYMIGRTLM